MQAWCQQNTKHKEFCKKIVYYKNIYRNIFFKDNHRLLIKRTLGKFSSLMSTVSKISLNLEFV